VYSDQLGNIELAILAWTEVEREFGETDESMDALAMLLGTAERWGALEGLNCWSRP
jgi:hypothetical protein